MSSSRPEPAPVRVLHVIRRLDRPGGAERMVAELARRAPGHEVLVWQGGASFFDLGAGRLHRARGVPGLLLACLRARGTHDILHLHLPPAKYLAILLGRRAVIHEHSAGRAKRPDRLRRWLERRAVRRAGAVIAASRDAAAALARRTGWQARLQALPNFAATMEPAGGAPPVAAAGAGALLAMVASLRPPKRQDLAIRALALLPGDLRLVLAGTGPAEPACRELAAALGVADRVAFPGAVADVAGLYAAADLAVLASDREGFGLVVAEAAQLGLPTVVTDVPGLREFCPDPRLLAAPDDPAALAAVISRGLELARDPAFRDAMRAHAARFGLPAWLGTAEAIYRGLLTGRGRG